ncbi:TPA: site-specific DNA-methyltransferase [Vibrio parahaemolyticus]|nr:site-specific DNA-methyltransferase [Vibrio parahaemolyticus]MDF5394713.1 site-specific DNA-methyltransferase [Vibrio parahaemolyticus]HCH2231374.1 site-specific DNA-methyltransferase [Vibrio parahaemolyticus]
MNKETLFSNTETANSKQLEILQKHFPQCFDKQGNFIQEKLLEVVKSSDVELSKESYSLNWLGKSYARLLTNLPPKTLLSEDKQHNQLEANKDSQNLLIKGDNLEVLKHMVNAYSEKVKMIYIDPPYNTGSDGFVYNDDRKFTPQQLSELAGIDLAEAKRILAFTVKGSSSHSAWLTFMYPRLYVARHLLRSDGVIFMSIDDNEANQLKILSDEIFGEQNFIADVCVVNNLKGRNDKKNIATANERLLMYRKSDEFEEYGLEPPATKLNEFKYADEHGKFRLTELRKRGGADTRKDRPNMYYPFYTDPTTGAVSLCKDETHYLEVLPVKSNNIDGRWRWGRTTAELRLSSLLAKKVQNTERYNIYEKDYLETNGEIKRIKPKSVLFGSNYSTDSATKQYRQLMSDIDFSNPKPVQFLKDLILYSCPPNGGHICLDFFAGSGSTSHALLEVNAEDQGNRVFISIQREEPTAEKSQAREAGIESIFDITKERISRTLNKIQTEYPDYKGDLGFKIFETVEDFRVKDEGELTLENHSFFDDAVLTDKQYNTLLTTWCVYDGSLLTTPIQDVDLNGYTAHLCDKRLYLIAPNFNSETIKALLHELDNNKDFEPNKVVFYGNNFDSAKQMELNEALKGYANKKSLEIDLVVRN